MILDSETLKKRLRYQGQQYTNGQFARGGGNNAPHMLEQAADRIEALEREIAAFREASKEAPDILDLMIRCSKTSCPPMYHLLTTDGLYGFHMANLWVRNDGKEYTMEADWADNCGKLVKRLTELLTANDQAKGPRGFSRGPA